MKTVPKVTRHVTTLLQGSMVIVVKGLGDLWLQPQCCSHGWSIKYGRYVIESYARKDDRCVKLIAVSYFYGGALRTRGQYFGETFRLVIPSADLQS